MADTKSEVKNQKSKEMEEIKETKAPAKKLAVKAKKQARSQSTDTVREVLAKAPVKKRIGDLAVDVFDLSGKSVEKLTLPREVFGVKVNKALMAQAVRVHLINMRHGTASTKTRGEVTGSTRKIYRQKGTGRARHGGVRAPIFVHGGVAFGPKPRTFSLSLSKKMRKGALASALSSKVLNKSVKIVAGLTTIKPKTKEMVHVLKHLSLDGKKRSILLVTDADNTNIARSVRNIEGVDFLKATQLSTYEVLSHRVILMMKEAVDTVKDHIVTKK